MEEEYIKGVSDYIAILRRHRMKTIVTICVIAVISAVVAFILPPVYESSATILIEQQEIPRDLVQTTVTSYADQRIQVISQRVKTSANLRKIIDKFGLNRDKRRLAVVFEELRRDIKLEMVSADVIDPESGKSKQATIAFALSYSNRSPRIALDVATELVSLYLDENVKRRSRAANETMRFFALESQKLSELISSLEAQMASFKDKHANSLPELNAFNLQLLDRSEQRILEIDRQIRALNERKIYLQSELAQLNPFFSSGSGLDGRPIVSLGERLKAVQTELISRRGRYSANHPDVIKLRKELDVLKREMGGGDLDKKDLLAELENKRNELVNLKKQYSDDHPDVKKLVKTISMLEKESTLANERSESGKRTDLIATNPAYKQIYGELKSTEYQLASLRKARERQSGKISKLEKRISLAPQVEREYRELARDYENASEKYREIKSKQMQAQIAKAMEDSQKGERFTLIEPPLLAEKPVSPNRLLILFGGLLAAITSALILVAFLESLDQSIRGVRAFSAITRTVPLVTVPYITIPAEQQEQLENRQRLMKIGGVAIILAILVVHFFIKPVDIIWLILRQRVAIL